MVTVVAEGLQPGNEQARTWLRDELSKSRYHPHENPLERIADAIDRWLGDLLDGLTHASTPIPGLLAAIGAVLLVVAGVYLLRFVRRTPRRADTDTSADLGDLRLGADALRERARKALADNNFNGCVVDSMRAIAHRGVERTLLDDTPSRTAHEVADALIGPFPQYDAELRWAADIFDSVVYGHRDADEHLARRILDLEAELAATRPRSHRSAGQPIPVPT